MSRSLIWYLDYYLVPRLPPSHVRSWLEAAAFRANHRGHPLYRGFEVRYRPGRYLVSHNGATAQFHSGLENHLALGEVTGYLMRHGLRQGDVVIDAGAYEGVFAILAAQMVGPGGKVIAFEPDSQNRAKLEANILLNGIRNVTVVGKGLWSRDGTLQFCESGKDFSCIGSGDLTTPVNRGWSTNTTVDVTSLDREMDRLAVDHIDFLKADVEGAEIEMLKGAKITLERSDARLSIASYHVLDGTMSCYRVEELLRGFGYHAETNFPHHPTTYGWKDRSERPSA